MKKKASKSKESTASNIKRMEIELASKEVNTWPQWKLNLSGIESNYKVHIYRKPKTTKKV